MNLYINKEDKISSFNTINLLEKIENEDFLDELKDYSCYFLTIHDHWLSENESNNILMSFIQVYLKQK